MDASVLRSLLEKVLRSEKEFKVQANLEQARDAVSNMAGAPQEPSYQTAFAESLRNLRSSLAKFASALSPAEWDRLEEIHSAEEFSHEIMHKIDTAVNENAATPAVIRDLLTAMASARREEIDSFQVLFEKLLYYGFTIELNDFDKAQIGFKIPREIFDNQFGGLIAELNFIKKFVRLISEAEGENPDEISVGTISTSDPLVWLIMAYGVAKTIAGITDWCLATWKTVEDIRNVRAQTAKLKSFEPDEIEHIFGEKIVKEIDSAIEAKAAELTAAITDKPRAYEVQNGLRPTLRQFLARIERGLTVDVRYLPPPLPEAPDEGAAEDREEKKSEMHIAASKLNFPRPVGDPILRLEAANDDSPKVRPNKPKP